MTLLKKLVILVAITLTAGCVRYEPKPISPAAILAQFEGGSLGDARLKTFLENRLGQPIPQWPVSVWRPQQLTLAAFYFNPELEIARAQWRGTEAAVITAGGRPNPSLSITPGYNLNAASGVSPWMPGFSFDLPMETAGKRNYRLERARALAASARLNIMSVAWQIQSNLRMALLDFSSAEKRESILQEQQSIQETAVKLLEERRQAGAISSFEVSASRIALNRIILDMGDARRLRTEARGRLAAAVGLPVTALASIKIDPAFSSEKGFSDTELVTLRQRALQNRADVLALLAEYAAEEAALRLEVAKQYPDVHFGPAYQWDQGESKWSLGVTVELPVFNRNQGPIAEAKAKRDEIAARLIALQATAISQIDQAISAWHESSQQMDIVEGLRVAQEKHQASVSAQAAAGSSDNLDVLNAKLESSAVELLRADAQAKRDIAFATMENALQQSSNETVDPAVVLFPEPPMNHTEIAPSTTGRHHHERKTK